MSLLKKLFSRDEDGAVDYYEEAMALMKVGQYHEALTSLRLALRAAPDDVAVLMQMAVAYTRIGMTDEAAKTYRTVLRKDPAAAGANYGLAFLLLHEGNDEEAAQHLRAFLDSPPSGPDAERHISHARGTLSELSEASRSGRAKAEPEDAPDQLPL